MLQAQAVVAVFIILASILSPFGGKKGRGTERTGGCGRRAAHK